MSQLIYRDEAGVLQIGTDSDSEQLAASVFRCESTKEIIEREGVFVEISSDSERVLFATA
ncbi:MAG: hypothetical protein IIB77_06565 [Proteobacteria bacterium]|nr:hypothetical protein [Pseudomonadota bacterium]